MIDFHTHILPDIDDGSRGEAESIRMIEMLVDQGVKKIFLTPHFYAYLSSSGKFAEKRKKSFEILLKALEGKTMDVELYLGGEVLYFDDLWRIDSLDEFCIKGTNYILIEMPFFPWENAYVECICKIINRGYVPIVAHFERYLKYKGNKSKIKSLVEYGCMLQMNCSYLNSAFTRGKALRYIKNGMVFALGSDCHNLSDRCPDTGAAYAILKKKLKKNDYELFVKKQQELTRKATVVYSSK